jgi:hypothetical protein
VVTLARTGVEIDYRGDVIDSHAPEMPTRFAKQLTMLMRGGIAIGMPRIDALTLKGREWTAAAPLNAWWSSDEQKGRRYWRPEFGGRPDSTQLSPPFSLPALSAPGLPANALWRDRNSACLRTKIISSLVAASCVVKSIPWDALGNSGMELTRGYSARPLLDALREALGEVLAEQQQQWGRERVLIEAQAAAVVANLRVEIITLTGKFERRPYRGRIAFPCAERCATY